MVDTRRRARSDSAKYAAALSRQAAPRREAERQRMLATETPVPRRITIALDMRQLYGPDVDIACGGEEPMVDEWEAGTRKPTGEQVVLLAALTQYPVEFFYKPVAGELGPIWMCDRHCRYVTKESLRQEDEQAREREASRLFWDDLDAESGPDHSGPQSEGETVTTPEVGT